ncbi:MAG: S-ribosylhomocysteine lyase [Bacteroidia bacterium]|nr:MAG: S-ribosylhomocysteine lyase [Bacteroidia bacterium]
MDKIASFTIDHIKLQRGVYVSRRDHVGPEVITTFDIRMKAPNREPVMDQGAIHTLEHLAATYLRNDGEWKDRIIYWGPMGCLTGNYLLVRGEYLPEDMLEVLRRTFAFVASFEGEVPGTSPRDCGSCQLHNLPLAREEARKYLEEVLERMGEENMRYPKTES